MLYSHKNVTTGEKQLVELTQNICVNKQTDKEEETKGKGHCNRKYRLQLNIIPSDWARPCRGIRVQPWLTGDVINNHSNGRIADVAGN